MAKLDTREDFLSVWRHLALTPGRTLGALQQGKKDEYIIVTAASALQFEPDRDYTETEVNRVLEHWLEGPGAMIETDHVQLRRALVDCGLIERDGYGRSYRRAAAAPEPWRAALAAFDDVDFANEAERARAADATLRAERKARWLRQATG